MNNNNGTIKSVNKAFDIIRCFDNYEELGISEISRKLQMNKSTVFSLVSTLCANEILQKNQETRKYRLGIELFRLGTRINISLKELVFPYLERLVIKYHETANLVVMEGTSVIYLEKVEGPHAMRISTSVGGKKPLYCTAVGKAILAFTKESDLQNIISRLSMEKYTENTIVDKETLIKSLNDIKTKGFAEDCEELEIGLHCIAAPIFNQYKTPFAAISVSGPVSRMEDELRNKISEDLVVLSQEISKQLGYV